MDPQILIAAAVSFIILVILVYLISVFGMREKSFDEVMAEQKRRQEEELLKSRSEKKAEKESKKKWSRRKTEKTREKGLYSQSEVIVETSTVSVKPKTLEYDPDPEIINPEDFPFKETKVTKSKNKKTKSILVNKEEKAPVSNELHAPSLFHPSAPPKDEVELRHKTVTEEHKVTKKQEERPSKGDGKILETSSHVVKEEMIRATTDVQHTSSTLLNSSMTKTADKKKTKAHGGSGDAEATYTTNRLISAVRSATLNDVEVQTMIDILLNKQQGSAAIETWSKKSQKGDPVALLKKQLEEKERALQEEQQLAMAANNKLKEVKQEIAQEKARYSSLEKKTGEKMSLQAKEIQALHARMQQTHETHMVEKNSLQARMSQMENQMGPGNQNLIQKLTDENKQLKESLDKIKAESIPAADMSRLTQKIQILETELGNSHIKLNAAENSKKTLEAKVAKYEEQLRSVETGQKDTEVVLSKKLEEVSQQLRKTEGQKDTLSTEMQKAQTECHALKTQLKELEKTLSGANENSKGLQAKLEASEQQKVTLQTSVQSLEQRMENFRKEQAEKDAELNKLRVDNRSLSDQLRKQTERQQGEGQEEPSQPDGAPNGHLNHDTKVDKSTIQLQEYQKLLSEKEKEIARLTSDLNGKHEEISKLTQEIEKQKQKNNEIREKNWKAMEALDKTEKSIEERVVKAVNSSREKYTAELKDFESYDKSVMQRIFPEISVSSSMAHKDWMSSFEEEAVTYISTLSSKAGSPVVDPRKEERLKQAEERAVELEDRLREAIGRSQEFEGQLREAEEKAMDAMNRLSEEESRASDLASRLREADAKASDTSRLLTEVESQRQSVEVQLREVNMRKTELESRLQTVEAELQKMESSSSQTTVTETRLLEVEQQRDKLESQIKEYRSVLSETEDKLQQLQTSVESEEQKWIARLQSTEAELTKTRQELLSLTEEFSKSAGSNEDLDHLGFTYRCVEKSLKTIVEEMEEKIISMESQLKSSETKYTTVQKQLSEAQTKISSLQIQLSEAQQSSSSSDLQETVTSLRQQLQVAEEKKNEADLQVIELENRITVLQTQLQDGEKSDVDLSALKKLIAELQAQVEVEKKRNKELSSNVVRLNGTVKIGQDALAEEQRLVKQLQDQLALKNGTGPVDADSLKAKLADTQKQLEREIMANRQLSQRLRPRNKGLLSGCFSGK
ncbi:ribosome-binding protein 1-like isoform X3 [Liolophura sinensis]|uniref:ribosome-binding protein 1-like isoform X3 n=1 Tax=Liolophura sinensis TaxID=3198878 RepID=UPI0031598450